MVITNKRNYNNLPLHQGAYLVKGCVDWKLWNTSTCTRIIWIPDISIQIRYWWPLHQLVSLIKAAALKTFNKAVRNHYVSFQTNYTLSLDLICANYPKDEILKKLHLGKSQSYANTKGFLLYYLYNRSGSRMWFSDVRCPLVPKEGDALWTQWKS